MKFFMCWLDPAGRGISETIRRGGEAFARDRELQCRWWQARSIAVLAAWAHPHDDTLVAQAEHWVAAGVVRLDNRPDLERWAECDCEGLTDLEVVLRVVARHGTRYVAQFLGDFAFVVWDSIARTAVAACDTFAVQRLYYTEQDGLFAFASRAEPLARTEGYELEYLTRIVALYGPPRHRTVYPGVSPVPAASMGVLDRGKLILRQYWSALDFEPEPRWANSEPDAIDTCRQLLVQAVRARLGGADQTWAQLSGGLDSSSVVSVVQWLAEHGEIPHGLAGTVTFVDRQGTGADEREYSSAVVDRWGVQNETIVDPPTWYDDRYALPRIDQPTFDLQFYPRDRAIGAVIRAAGGRVLLTGWGGDELFRGTMLFFADWLVRGRIWPAVREMARRAAIGRVSFWELAYKNAVLPLFPTTLRNRLVHSEFTVQPWLRRDTLQRFGLTSSSPMAAEYAGPLGGKYRYAVAERVGVAPQLTADNVLADSIESRHPFLHRPLVEFALRLPPELRARPHAHRWVLREAMRGILPEKVRTRVGKQDTGSALSWSLSTARTRLTPLLQNPILADLGVVDATRLRAAFETAPQRVGLGEWMDAQLLSTLAIEAWLQMRSGRWPQGGHRSTDAIARN